MDKRLERVINYFREEITNVANAPGTGGGFGASSAAKGPTAGYDPSLGRIDRRKKKNKNYPKEITTFYNRLLKFKGDVYKATANGRRSS